MKFRALFNKDGTVTGVTPAISSKRKKETEVQWFERAYSKIDMNNVSFALDMESKDIPEGYTLDDADYNEKDKSVSFSLKKRNERLKNIENKANKKQKILDKLGLTEEEFNELFI